MAPGRRRVGSEIYWTIRRSSSNVRAYLTSYFPGERTSKAFGDLWLVAEMIDIECDSAYRAGGMASLQCALAYSDTLEHCLSRLGAEVAFLLHKDPRMYQDLLTAKPPGQSDLMPDWAITSARDQSKAAFLEAGRVKGGNNKGGAVHESDEEGGAPRRRKRGVPKAKAGAGAPADPKKK